MSSSPFSEKKALHMFKTSILSLDPKKRMEIWHEYRAELEDFKERGILAPRKEQLIKSALQTLSESYSCCYGFKPYPWPSLGDRKLLSTLEKSISVLSCEPSNQLCSNQEHSLEYRTFFQIKDLIFCCQTDFFFDFLFENITPGLSSCRKCAQVIDFQMCFWILDHQQLQHARQYMQMLEKKDAQTMFDFHFAESDVPNNQNKFFVGIKNLTEVWKKVCPGISLQVFVHVLLILSMPLDFEISDPFTSQHDSYSGEMWSAWESMLWPFISNQIVDSKQRNLSEMIR